MSGPSPTQHAPSRPARPSRGGVPADRWVSRALFTLAAPLAAVAFAAAVTSVALAVTGASPLFAFGEMLRYAAEPSSQVFIVNQATTYYLAALAVAVGFRMNLFNIGVDGQYRLAAMLAAAVGGAVALPKPLHIGLVVLVAMVVGAAWAGIAALLRVGRGVSEVISTIMLNYLAGHLVAYLLNTDRLAVQTQGSNNIGTRPIPESGHMPAIPVGEGGEVFGFVVVAALVGLAFHVVLNRTRFGFDLRATGTSESAAVASGVNVRRMVVATMLISGAVAGLVGMPQLLGASYSYALDFPAGLGFTGIAIALLGRNNPLGIAFGALLWAFLDRSGGILEIHDINREVVVIMQGTIVLSVVVAYELVRRYRLRREQQQVGERLATAPTREVTA